MRNLLQTEPLLGRAYWLVRLRWIAVAFLFSATVIAGEFLQVGLPVRKIYVFCFILLIYNFLLWFWLRFLSRGRKRAQVRGVSPMIYFQIVGDLLTLTIILHLSGGIENPFFLYYVFHMVLVSTLLNKQQSYTLATLAALMFIVLVTLEGSGLIPHYHLRGFAGETVYQNSVHVFGILFVFVTTLYFVVYMTNSISDQLRIEQDKIREANILLEKKDQLKNEYVMRVNHDIRGHLAAVEALLDVVVSGAVGKLNEKQDNMIQRAHARTKKCSKFSTALLKLTRMKLTGRLDMEVFDISDAVEGAVAVGLTKADTKNNELIKEIEEPLKQVYGEPDLIEETISNLILNAVKYTPSGGKVWVRAKSDGDDVLIEISDTGIGVPEDEIEHLFTEFYRASNARKVERDGTGLGLSMAKEVIERHGGNVWAKRREQGGSSFFIRLPRNLERAKEDADKDSESAADESGIG